MFSTSDDDCDYDGKIVYHCFICGNEPVDHKPRCEHNCVVCENTRNYYEIFNPPQDDDDKPEDDDDDDNEKPR